MLIIRKRTSTASYSKKNQSFNMTPPKRRMKHPSKSLPAAPSSSNDMGSPSLLEMDCNNIQSNDEFKVISSFRSITPTSKKRVLKTLSDQSKTLTRAEAQSLIEQSEETQKVNLESDINVFMKESFSTYFESAKMSIVDSLLEDARKEVQEFVKILENRKKEIGNQVKEEVTKHIQDVYKVTNTALLKQQEDCKNRKNLVDNNFSELRRRVGTQNYPHSKKRRTPDTSLSSTATVQSCYYCDNGCDCLIHRNN